jgi:hypothetical protein
MDNLWKAHTYHDKPRYVMMSVEDFVRLRGVRLIADPAGLPDSVVARLRELADAFPDEEAELAGGLADLIRPDGTGGVRP